LEKKTLLPSSHQRKTKKKGTRKKEKRKTKGRCFTCSEYLAKSGYKPDMKYKSSKPGD
jgi:hypothetical protein